MRKVQFQISQMEQIEKEILKDEENFKVHTPRTSPAPLECFP